jgi:putative ABC transport system permease protein
MIIFKLALKNLRGAGIRTWLNVIVLSIAFVAIIWSQGLYLGMNEQTSQSLTETIYGGGQYWQKNYDPYDLISLDDAYAPIPDDLTKLIVAKEAVPLLIHQATAYPNGRMVPLQLKGIPAEQTVLNLPSNALAVDGAELPAFIGTRTAKRLRISLGDYLTIRWRDRDGVFDATDAKIVHIMKTTVPAVDLGSLWLPLDRLRRMLDMPDEATMVVLARDVANPPHPADWSFKTPDYLLADLRQIVKQKSISASIIYTLLLFLGMLAIFDTQVLSIFRRQKEIGTLAALGMTRTKIIQLFTLEGALHGVLAALLGALWGSPLMWNMSHNGWKLPGYSDDFGIALGEKLYPLYSSWLVVGTTLLVLASVTIVSFLPTRRISRLKATDALRGKRI